MASWLVIFVQFTLFLLIGVLLFVYYGDQGLTAPAQRDRIYPEFVWHNLPPGLAGLIIAAILAAAMANLSAALNSLASTTVVDFYRDARQIRERRLRHENRALGHGRVGYGAACHRDRRPPFEIRVLEVGLTIGSIPMGALLGVFLLGVLTRKPREGAAIAGVASGLAAVLGVHFFTPVAWTWYVLIGTVTTFGVGLAASVFQGPPPPPPLEEALVRQPLGGTPYLPSRHANPEE